MKKIAIWIFLTLISASPAATAANDTIELKNGNKIEGHIVSGGQMTQVPAESQSAVFDTPDVWIITKEAMRQIPTSEIKTIRFAEKPAPGKNAAKSPPG